MYSSVPPIKATNQTNPNRIRIFTSKPIVSYLAGFDWCTGELNESLQIQCSLQLRLESALLAQLAKNRPEEPVLILKCRDGSEQLFQRYRFMQPRARQNRLRKPQAKRINTMAADTATYTYDNLGRIKTVTFTNGTVITYNYDAMGNRTSVVTSCPSGTC